MRIGTSLLLQNQNCVQSYGWELLRPLGDADTAVSALSEYACDDISFIRIARGDGCLAEFTKDLDVIRKLKCSTPVAFGGGLRSITHLELLRGLPIERLVFSSAFITKDVQLLKYAQEIFGRQSIQCLLPISAQADEFEVFCCNKNQYIKLINLDFDFISEFANEIILYDTRHDGCGSGFDTRILNAVPISPDRLVFTGGIGKAEVKWAKQLRAAGVLIDNKTLHKESSIAGYRYATRM